MAPVPPPRSLPSAAAAGPLALATRTTPLEKETQRWVEQNRLIDDGRALLEKNDAAGAHLLFERAYLLNLNDLRCMSHYGLTLVMVEGDRQRGIRFCEEATRRDPRSSELLINLARALVQTRNKEQAVRALAKAQELKPDDPAVREAFETLGLRRPPIIGWLSRDFFLNRWLGRLSWRLRHIGQPRLR